MYQLSIIYGDNDVNVTWNNNINSGILQTCLKGCPLGSSLQARIFSRPFNPKEGLASNFFLHYRPQNG